MPFDDRGAAIGGATVRRLHARLPRWCRKVLDDRPRTVLNDRMRYDPDHKARTRKALLAEAAEAIRRDGPDRVGVAAIMSRLGLTHGGFYGHFKSKDALIAAAIDEMFQQQEQAFSEQVSGRPVDKALANYIDTYLSVGHVRHAVAGCPLPALSGDVARLGPSARKRFAAGVMGQRLRISTLLAKLGFSRAEATALATSMVSEMSGAIALARAMADPDEIKAICDRSRASIKKRLGIA